MKNIRKIAVTAVVMISMLLPAAFTALAAPGRSAGHGCHSRRADNETEYYCDYHQDYHTGYCEDRGHNDYERSRDSSSTTRRHDSSCCGYTES